MSNDDKFGFSDKTAVDLDGSLFRKEDQPKETNKPIPRSASTLEGAAPGTIRQDGPPVWSDDDDDDGEKTAALDLAALGLLNPDGSIKPLSEAPGAAPAAEFEEEEMDATMALSAQAVRAELSALAKPAIEVEEPEEKTMMADAIDFEEPEEKTMMADAIDFEEPEEKTMMADA
ncbi:MAG: hypothetical protein ACI9OJ_002973, partial [Myxococcota bacterium]